MSCVPWGCAPELPEFTNTGYSIVPLNLGTQRHSGMRYTIPTSYLARGEMHIAGRCDHSSPSMLRKLRRHTGDRLSHSRSIEYIVP